MGHSRQNRPKFVSRRGSCPKCPELGHGQDQPVARGHPHPLCPNLGHIAASGTHRICRSKIFSNCARSIRRIDGPVAARPRSVRHAASDKSRPINELTLALEEASATGARGRETPASPSANERRQHTPHVSSISNAVSLAITNRRSTKALTCARGTRRLDCSEFARLIAVRELPANGIAGAVGRRKERPLAALRQPALR